MNTETNREKCLALITERTRTVRLIALCFERLEDIDRRIEGIELSEQDRADVNQAVEVTEGMLAESIGPRLHSLAHDEDPFAAGVTAGIHEIMDRTESEVAR